MKAYDNDLVTKIVECEMPGRLGVAIRARVEELRVPVRRLAEAGFISQSTLERVLRGQDALRNEVMESVLERGLGWAAGSIRTIREGEAPTAIPVRTWPRADGDWKTAIEQAWSEWEAEPHDGQLGSHGPADPTTLAVSKEIRVWLIRRDLTEDDLAEAAGIPRPAMKARFKGDADWTVGELLAVASALRVSPLDLLSTPDERGDTAK